MCDSSDNLESPLIGGGGGGGERLFFKNVPGF